MVMKKNIYSYLDTLTDEYVPNNLDSIMNQIDMTKSITLKTIPMKKGTHSPVWKYSIAAACFCAIIISATVLKIDSNISTSSHDTASGTANSTSIDRTPNLIYWNIVEESDSNRLAINFKTTDKETWISKFPVRIPEAVNYKWELGYRIDKELGTTQDLEMGYFSCDINNVGNLTGRIIPSTSLVFDDSVTLLYFGTVTSSDEFKLSNISNYEVFLGSDGKKLYAAFNDGKYNFYLTLESKQKDDLLKVLDSILM